MNKFKQLKTQKYQWLFILLGALVIAIASHSFFIVELLNGKFMTGPRDGLSQMLPFKQLLYEQYSIGNFFYADRFGMGGGTYSQLSYYFSTSLFFIGSVAVTYLLELAGIIDQPTIFYWAYTLIPISVIRVTLIILVTTYYFKYMKLRTMPAFIGAVLYGTSVIYFRHVTYWEFFADAMLWLPILLYGVEKVIREGKANWFVFALVLCLVNNFYFAYINILLATIYIICRWFIKLSTEETSIIVQIRKYIVGGIIAFGISAVSFIPAVYGYLNNHRIAYEADIPLLLPMDNPFLDGRIIVIPAFAMICLFIRAFYRNKTFTFFSVLFFVSIILHMSPIVASVFNGFSAPQYRWEYFLALAFAGVIAISLQQLHLLTKKAIGMAIIGMLMIYALSYIVDPVLTFTNWTSGYLVYAMVATIVLMIRFMFPFGRTMVAILMLFIIATSVYTSNFYQYVKLSQDGNVQASTKEWMQSEAYQHEDQKTLLEKIAKDEQNGDFYRIDWMTAGRNNTPIVQGFNGFSVYSSILNKHLLYFYLYDLEIDTGKESVSRYGTLGNRANLASILAGKYMIAKQDDKNIPFGFQPKYAVGDYIAYENDYVLPFARTTKKVYTEAQLTQASILERERAMIDGIVLTEAIEPVSQLQGTQDIGSYVDIQENGASFTENHLQVTEKSGGIDLIVDEQYVSNAEDYYVSFQLKRLDQNRQFKLNVNEYTTTRKKNSSIYKTGVDDLTIRVKAAPKISIRLPEGSYALTDLQLFAEDYELLKQQQKTSDVSYEWDKNVLKATLNNEHQDQFIQFPIPFEKGWKAYINGEKQEVLQANYAFIGLALKEGENEIRLIYRPPYFELALSLSVFSMLLAWLIYRRKGKGSLLKRKNKK